MKHYVALACAIVFASLLTARGQGADENYVRIYTLIQEADALKESGQAQQAFTKYSDAQTALKHFQTVHPGWNDKVVNFRLNYIAARLATLGGKFAQTTSPPAAAEIESFPAGSIATNQLKALQEEIGRLTGRNALLEAKLKEALSVQPAASDPRELAKAEEQIKQLQKEKELLRVSLEQEQAKAGKPADLSAIEQERKILAETKQKLAQQTELTASLQRENDSLKQQLALAGQNLTVPKGSGDLVQELQLARMTIAALQATNIALRTEQILLETRVAELSKDVKRGNRSSSSRADERDQQLEAAQARLAVYEAKPVPYSPEELALFKQPDARLSAAESTPPKKKTRELPPGTRPLAEEAQRALEAGRFEEAEKKYREVLRQDENNVFALGNLAAIQMEQNRLADAEGTLKKALAADSQDAASLYLLGRLKLMQEKYDEALDSLSRSAKIIPDEARTQYFLGKALIQKGNRVAAETALRKAVQLKPGWSEAHYSLAMVYATQQPPFKELAQWHYQKAIAGGYPRNIEFEKLIEGRKTASSSVP
jgi:Flp pilus assembly protein TadD